MWLSGDHGRLIKWHPLVNFKFGELRKSEVLERKLMEEKHIRLLAEQSTIGQTFHTRMKLPLFFYRD